MSLRRNVIANYAGQAWVALMGLAFIPSYIHYLGIEGYGLIGVFAIFQAWLALLDFGTTPILTREMARLGAGASDVQTSRDLLRGTEFALSSFSVVVIGAAGLGSHWLATEWLKVDGLPVSTVRAAITLMAAVACSRSLEAVYRGCAMGQNRQVAINIIAAAFATLRGAGAVSVLAWLSPTVLALFAWQLFVSLATLVTLAVFVYRHFRKSRTRPFSFRAWFEIRRFAGGMLAITLLSLLLTQIDKVLLTKLLSLKDYGYYALAAVVANALYLVVGPIAQAYFPRFSEYVAEGEPRALVSSYHQGAQLVSVTLGPAALTLMLFAAPVLSAWTGNLALSRETAPLLAALCLGTLLNGLLWIPYQMQLAHGHTRTALILNTVAVIVMIPALVWVTPRYGAVGAAWLWVTLNAALFVFGMTIMYRRLLRSEKWRWYVRDVGSPLLAAAVVIALCSWTMPTGLSRSPQILWILFTLGGAHVAACAAIPELRGRLVAMLPDAFERRVR